MPKDSSFASVTSEVGGLVGDQEKSAPTGSY